MSATLGEAARSLASIYLDFAGRQLKCLQFFRRVQRRYQHNVNEHMAMKKVQTIVYQLENG